VRLQAVRRVWCCLPGEALEMLLEGRQAQSLQAWRVPAQGPPLSRMPGRLQEAEPVGRCFDREQLR